MRKLQIRPTTSKHYVDSPLGQMIHGVLGKIHEIKNRYPVRLTDGIEKKHADSLVALVENLFNKLNSNVLPRFSNQNIDISILGIIRDLWDLRDLNSHFMTRKYALFLAIKNILPTLIKEANQAIGKGLPSNSDPKDRVNTYIIRYLEQHKDAYFDKASTIPGKGLEELLVEITNALLTCNFFGLSKDELHQELWNIEHELFIFDIRTGIFHGQYEYVIAHPMAYELFMAVIVIIQQAPKELCALLPFFNPESLVVDLHSGLVGSMVAQITGDKTFELKYLKNEQGSKLSYVYESIMHQKGLPDVMEQFSVEDYYAEFILGTKRQFITAIQQYSRDYSETILVKSINAQRNLLQEYIAIELNDISDRLEEFRKSLTAKPIVIDELQGSELLKTIDADIVIRQQLLAGYDQIWLYMEQCIYRYTQSSVEQLIKVHPRLLEQIRADYERRFDLAYLKDVLPDETPFNFEPVIQQLLSAIEKHRQIFRLTELSLRETINHLVLKREEALNTWIENTKQVHREITQKQLARFNEYLDYFENLSGHSEEIDIISLPELQRLLEQITHQYNELEALSPKVLEVLQTLRQSVSCLVESFDSGNAHSLKEALKDISKPVKYKAEELQKDIASLTHRISIKQHSLVLKIQKVHEDMAFIENMQSATPEKMRQILKQDTFKKELLIAEREKIHLRLQDKRVVLQSVVLDELNASMLKLKEEEVLLESDNIQLVQKIERISVQYKLIQQGILPEEELYADLVDLDQQELFSSDDEASLFVANIRRLTFEFQRIAILQSINHHRSTNEELYVLALKRFEKAKKLIEKSKDETEIPFKAIDKDPFFVEQGGFNGLINLIDPKNTVFQGTTLYRERQDDFFSFHNRPSKQEFLVLYDKLIQSIQAAEIEVRINYDRSMHAKNMFNICSEGIAALKQIKDQLANNELTRLQLIVSYTNMDSQCAQKTQQREVLNQEINAHLESIQDIDNQVSAIDGSQIVVVKMIGILERINEFKEQINRFCAEQDHWLIEGQFNQSLLQKQRDLHLMSQWVISNQSDLLQLIPQLGTPEYYQASLSTVSVLIDTLQLSASSAIQEKFAQALSPINNLIDENTQALVLLNSEVNDLSEFETPDMYLQKFKQLQSISSRIRHHNTEIANLRLIGEQSTSNSSDSLLQTTEILHTEFKQSVVNTGNRLLSRIKSILDVQHSKLEDIEYNETQSKSVLNTNLLIEIEKQMGYFSEEFHRTLLVTTEAMDSEIISLLNPSTTNLSDNCNLVNQQLERHKKINTDLSKRIEQVNQLISKLDSSWSDIKDTLKLNSKKSRETFFSQLNLELINYINSGDSNLAITLMQNNINQFSDLKFRTILYQTICALVDLDRQTQKDYTIPQEEEVDQQSAIHNTNTVNMSDKEYTKWIEYLYTQTTEMKVFGEELSRQKDPDGLVFAD